MHGEDEVEDLSATFEELDIDDGARLTVGRSALPTPHEIASNLVALNPRVTVGELLSRVTYNDDKSIKRWDLSRKAITKLPDSFCFLTVSEDLILENTPLVDLPASFEQITVGGILDVRRCRKLSEDSLRRLTTLQLTWQEKRRGHVRFID